MAAEHTGLETALLGVILGMLRWYYDRIYDGSHVPRPVRDAEEAFAKSHGVVGPANVATFIKEHLK